MNKISPLLHNNLNDERVYLDKSISDSLWTLDCLLIIRERKIKMWNLTTNLRNLLVDSYHDNQ